MPNCRLPSLVYAEYDTTVATCLEYFYSHAVLWAIILHVSKVGVRLDWKRIWKWKDVAGKISAMWSSTKYLDFHRRKIVRQKSQRLVSSNGVLPSKHFIFKIPTSQHATLSHVRRILRQLKIVLPSAMVHILLSLYLITFTCASLLRKKQKMITRQIKAAKNSTHIFVRP